MTDFRVGDKVRLKSTGQIGHVDEVDAMTGAPYVRFENNPHNVVCCVEPSAYCDLEVVEAIQRHTRFKDGK
jgi:hypothetical protein